MIQRIARTRTFGALLTLSIIFSNVAVADFPTISGIEPTESDRWSATRGQTTIQLMPGVTEGFGLTLTGSAKDPVSDMPGELGFSVQAGSSLEFWAPAAAWDGFTAGSLEHAGRLALGWDGGALALNDFSVAPVGQDALGVFDNAGNQVFRLDYIHTMLYPEFQQMTMRNMDVSITPWLAARMGRPELDGTVIAVAYTHTDLDIPMGGQTEGTCSSPNWHNGTTFITDVELINLGSVQQVARQAGVRVAIAPSATLRNVGTADVPWFEKFTTGPGGTYPQPYNRDQHPYLVWAMYRIVDDIPQQIGQSAVKHAFFTVNSSCTCGGGSILWSADSSPNGQGCTDTYGVGNNNSPSHLGIRDELPSFSGAFEQCGSMFAPGATPPGPCSQTVSGTTGDSFERRLVVDENELQTDNAQYYFEGWYVIRDDIDIFNTMAHKSVTPNFSGSWSFPAGAHTLGPAVDSWVAPNTRGANEAHDVQLTNDGHFSVAVKVTDLGENQYRYVYAVMNYDFDPRINKFEMDLPAGVVISNVQYLDGDKDGGNDWTHSTADGKLTFSAPAGGALEWGHMNTFVFEANAAPDTGDTRIEGFEKPAPGTAAVLTPGGIENLFKSGFEP